MVDWPDKLIIHMITLNHKNGTQDPWHVVLKRLRQSVGHTLWKGSPVRAYSSGHHERRTEGSCIPCFAGMLALFPKEVSILSVFSTVHQNEIPQPENHISLYLISCGLHLSEVHLAWCLISAFWFCKYMYCEHFPMCLGIRVALHLGYIALICCALCDGPTFAAFRPNSNATRRRSDLVWYVPHQYSFLEHDDM